MNRARCRNKAVKFLREAAAMAMASATISAAIAGQGQAMVSFTPPASDGGSLVTAYSVTCAPVSGGAAVITSGAASPIVVTGLTAGVTYTCTVSAINAAGTGAPSASSNPVLIAAVSMTATNIPTLNEWMLALLASILVTLGAGTIARQRR